MLISVNIYKKTFFQSWHLKDKMHMKLQSIVRSLFIDGKFQDTPAPVVSWNHPYTYHVAFLMHTYLFTCRKQFMASLWHIRSQHHYSYILGPLLSKTKVTWTPALWYYRRWLITKTDTKWLRWKSIQLWRHQTKECHLLSRTRKDAMRFYHTTKNDAWFKTDDIFIYGTFYLIFWTTDDCG